MKKLFALLMAAVMTMSLLAGCGQKAEDNNTSSGDNTADDSQYHIGFVVHTTSGDVMAAIEYGAKAAAEDYGVKLTYTGPADSDNTQQISMFESLVAAGCDAIVIIAGDSTVWDEPIAAAVEKGVTVVITDSDAPTSQRAAYFGVNTAKLAYDLGTAVRAQTGDEGTVALGVCVLGPESHTIRAEQVKAAYKDTDMQFTEVFETDLDTTLNYNNWENILTSNGPVRHGDHQHGQDRQGQQLRRGHGRIRSRHRGAESAEGRLSGCLRVPERVAGGLSARAGAGSHAAGGL